MQRAQRQFLLADKTWNDFSFVFINDQAKEQHYSTFHGYSTSWIQANKSKITTIGKRGFTDWLFDSGGRFEQMHSSVNHLVAVKSPVNCPSNHPANTPVNRHP